jgi:multidrug transporter EmrE-like cation transporter
MNKLMALLLVGVSLIFYAFGEYYSKIWSLKPSLSTAVLTTILYAISAILWLPALREHGQLSALSAVWSCLSVTICVIIGVYVFGETLTTCQIIGLALAFIATMMMI